MPASPIRKLVPYADAAKARGIQVLHLNIGQPDVESPPEFWHAIANTGLKVLEYSPSQGITELRQKLAGYYKRLGIVVEAENIIVTTAGSEALSFALSATLNPDEEVLIPEPMYANYIGFSTAAGVNVRPLPTRLDDDFRLPTIDQFEAALTPKTKAILICNPGNPTGTVYSAEQLDQLRELCLEKGLFLIGDEVYRDFNYTGQPIKSVLQLEGLEEQVIMVDSVSKRFSLCGARVGFFVSRNAELLDAALRFAQARLSPPTLEQIGVIAALDCPQSYYDNVREEYRARRDTLLERVARIPGAKAPKVEGAFYATVRLPIDDGDDFCQWLLESFDLNGKTVMMAPASGFYSTPGSGKDEVRIAYVLNRDRMNEAMDILEAALKVYPGRREPAMAQ